MCNVKVPKMTIPKPPKAPLEEPEIAEAETPEDFLRRTMGVSALRINRASPASGISPSSAGTQMGGS